MGERFWLQIELHVALDHFIVLKMHCIPKCKKAYGQQLVDKVN